MTDGVVVQRYQGTPQGGPLSPLLANVLLDEVDKELERRGHCLARYADDCNVYVRSLRAGQRVMAVLRKLYSKLRKWAAATFPDRLRCVASIHGANMASAAPHSPHRMAPLVRCESYFACAEIDKWAPPADIAQLQEALQGAATPHRIEWYPAVEHGFVFPLRAGIYNKVAAERHWERLFSLFARNLQGA